ncbi:MAG: fumarate hydratase, partial [Gemmatimonadetes bacterium]|nr:fumarate hydratase [Gemmatimonadota bacterium]
MNGYTHHELLPLGDDPTPYRLLTTDCVSTGEFEGRPILKVASEGLTLLADQAIRDSAHLLRPGHLAQLRRILDDPEASDNDRFVALDMLKNANIAAGWVLPMCQDTGTAIVMGKKGHQVWTEGDDEAAISAGIAKAYQETNLRYSQLAPLSIFEEQNTRTNLPAQVEIFADQGMAYKFMFMAKGGGSANKSYLFQETRALLTPERLRAFIDDKLRMIGTAACPPYHLALVIGGT